MIGLNAEPGWRRACVARSNWLRSKSQPPTSASTSPLPTSKREQRALDGRLLEERRAPQGARRVRLRGGGLLGGDRHEARHVAAVEHLVDRADRVRRASPDRGSRAQDTSSSFTSASCPGAKATRALCAGAIHRGDDTDQRLRAAARIDRARALAARHRPDPGRRVRRALACAPSPRRGRARGRRRRAAGASAPLGRGGRRREAVLHRELRELLLDRRGRDLAQRAAVGLALVELDEPAAQRRDGGPLQLRVERGLDDEAAAQHDVAAEHLEELRAAPPR